MRIPLPPAFLQSPIAHRALHNRSQGRIENSPAAIRAAIEAGYGIEIDIQLSADRVAMVFHDETLGRLTSETGPVSSRSAAELGAITLKGSTDKIPTLSDVLRIVSGRVPLLIELKDQTLSLSESDGALEEATARALQDYTGDVALMSFNPSMIFRMASLLPHVPRGLTTSSYDYDDWPDVPHATCDRLRDIPDYDRVEASFISHQGNDLDRARVAELRAQGAKILCWTIKSPAEEALARKFAHNVTFEGYHSPFPAPAT